MKYPFFFGLLILVTGCGDLVTPPKVGTLSDGTARSPVAISGTAGKAVVSYEGVAFDVPQHIGLLDLNGEPVCEASSTVLAEAMGLQVSCRASGRVWFDSGRERTGPEIYQGYLTALKSSGYQVIVTSAGVTISGDGEDMAAVVSGGPVDAPGVDFLGDGTSVKRGSGLASLSRQFGQLVSVSRTGGAVVSVRDTGGLLTVAEGVIAEASLDVRAFKSEGRLYLVGDASQARFVKASLEPNREQTVTLSTGPLKADTVDALKDTFPDVNIAHDEANGRLLVTGYGDAIQSALPALRPYLNEPRQVRVDGVFAEFTQKRSLEAGLQIAKENGSVVGSFGAALSGSNIAFQGGLSATLSLLENTGDVSVIARPTLTLLDGEEASFSSGEQVPFVGEAVKDDSGAVTQSINYRDTGIILRVQAFVLDDATVKLDVSIEISSVQKETGVVGNPVISQRSVSTTLRVTEGQSVVISGLTKQGQGSGSNGLPFLSRFGLGGMHNRSSELTELLFIVTPDVHGVNGSALRALPTTLTR